MNLIEDKWLPVVRADGRREKIAPWQITEQENPVMDVDAPRPDFQGAVYQFLIGLLQTAFAPEDHEDWLEYWEKVPDADLVRKSLENLGSAFELNNPDGPAFMQDYDSEGSQQWEIWPIERILSDSPSKNSITKNKDLFVKRHRIRTICESCAATALFTMQTNGQALGRSFRVGIRGGGPLTTIILPNQEKAILWKKIWLNIIPDMNVHVSKFHEFGSNLFPWMDKTITSEKNKKVFPEECLKNFVYWAMPCRIRLQFQTGGGICDLCGSNGSGLAHEVKVAPFGANFDGAWMHPLTPYYRRDKESFPISKKGKIGGLTYQDWMPVVLGNQESGEMPAATVNDFFSEKSHWLLTERFPKLWCFGYDLDKGKTRCWYEHNLPLFNLTKKQRDNLVLWIKDIISVANKIAEALQKQVKAAWFKRPGDARGNMTFVATDFWDQSESVFYRLLEKLSKLPEEQRLAPAEISEEWRKTTRTLAYRIFDAWALESPAEDLDMKRVVNARKGLSKKLNSLKSFKNLARKDETEKEATP